MAKSTHADVLDAALNYIKNNCTRMTVCDTLPTTYLEATDTYMLADIVMAGTDFTVAAGDAGGSSRKVTVGAKNNVDIDNTGDAINVALVDVSNTKLLYVTECTLLTLTAGQKVNFPAWDIEIGSPT